MQIDQSLGLKRDTVLDRLVIGIAVGFFLLTVALVSLQVVVRTFDFPMTLGWTEPAARLALIIGTYFGAAVATRNNEHISMDIVLQRLGEKSPRMKEIFDTIVRLITILTLFVVLFSLYTGANGGWNSNWADMSGVTVGMIYLAIAIGLTVMFTYELFELFPTDYFDQWELPKTIKDNE